MFNERLQSHLSVLRYFVRLPTMRKIRPKRKHTASVRNPLKTASVEVKLEYEEVKMGYAELEIRRKQKEKSKADFSRIST
jgi:hypothetical protein